MGIFKIEANNLHWINNNGDDPKDYCLHGDAIVYIGKNKLKYENATVSATALYLLKTLTEDHIIFQDNQMLPCCGFFYIPNDTLDNVIISGCQSGLDWTVKHEQNDVILILENGYEETVTIDKYKAEVFRFADIIEAYYKNCLPKKLPKGKKGEFDRNGYTAFWNEWHLRRQNQHFFPVGEHSKRENPKIVGG